MALGKEGRKGITTSANWMIMDTALVVAITVLCKEIEDDEL
jgi:hypothetical protein